MEEIINSVVQFFTDNVKKFSPYILGGAIGAIIHRLRTQMSWKQFLGSVIISIFVALSVGIVCKDYFKIEEDTVIFVLCGVSGTFSKAILDELEEIIKSASNIIKTRYGAKSESMVDIEDTEG